MPRKYRAIIHSSELITGSGVRQKDGRNINDGDLGVVVDGALVFSMRIIGNSEVPHRVEWVGKSRDLPHRYRKIPTKDLKNSRAVIPAMIDCHTHLVFSGNRSVEFSERCAGISYEEIAKRGGGIATTVRETRDATQHKLFQLASSRVKEMQRFGVKTIEIKSGYGLSLESELKILEVISQLKLKFPQMRLLSTFLGAHAFPSEIPRDTYLNEVKLKMLPRVAKEKLAQSCDVFLDQGFYSYFEAESILKHAQSLGFQIRLHADELMDCNATELAVKMGALSADHLLKISDENIKKIAASQTVAVLLPGTAYYLKTSHAPARKLIQAGTCVALATDFNPGTCMCTSLPTILNIAALYLGMSRAELLASVTYNAAKALGLSKSKGTLEAGKDADFAILPYPRFEETYYSMIWPSRDSADIE